MLRSALRERRYSPISSPGVGTITSVFRSSAASVARIHSTAGGSPCTRTILRGEIFLAYSISPSRVGVVCQDQERPRRPCPPPAEDRQAIQDSRSRQKISSAAGFRSVCAREHSRAYLESSSRWKGHMRVARATSHHV